MFRKGCALVSSNQPERPTVTLSVNGRLCVYGFHTFSSIQSLAEVLLLTIRKNSVEDICGNTSCLCWSRLKATRYSQQRSESLELSNSSSVSNPRRSWHLHSYIRETKSEKYISWCLKARWNGSGQFTLEKTYRVGSKAKVMFFMKYMPFLCSPGSWRHIWCWNVQMALSGTLLSP